MIVVVVPAEEEVQADLAVEAVIVAPNLANVADRAHMTATGQSQHLPPRAPEGAEIVVVSVVLPAPVQDPSPGIVVVIIVVVAADHSLLCCSQLLNPC